MKNDSEIKSELGIIYKTSSTISSMVELREEDGRVLIRLRYDRICEKSMQRRECAFEAWAVILYAVYGKTGNNTVIELSVVDENGKEKAFDRDISLHSGHLCRFLYRAMRFSEQYGEWFRLSTELEEAVDAFKEEFVEIVLTNDKPQQVASDGTYNEARVETWFAQNPMELQKAVADSVGLDIGTDKANKQLPVGLFKETEEGQMPVFSSGAIDLWNINGDCLNIIELKAINNNGKANDEIGIISEIFFYANYMHDLCVTKRFTMVEPQRGLGDDERGYQDIFDSVARNGINRINAIMLAPKYSEFIVDETVRILNNNCMDGLGYYKAIYDPEDIGTILLREQ